MAQTVFETDLPLVEQGLTWINTMVSIGVMTDALVLASTTAALLKSNLNAATVYETSRRFVEEVTREGGSIDRSVAIGALTDANIDAANTIAGLRALFTTQDANIGSATQQLSTVA